MVLKGYRIAHILPCLADPEKIRAIVELVLQAAGYSVPGIYL